MTIGLVFVLVGFHLEYDCQLISVCSSDEYVIEIGYISLILALDDQKPDRSSRKLTASSS